MSNKSMPNGPVKATDVTTKFMGWYSLVNEACEILDIETPPYSEAIEAFAKNAHPAVWARETKVRIALKSEGDRLLVTGKLTLAASLWEIAEDMDGDNLLRLSQALSLPSGVPSNLIADKAIIGLVKRLRWNTYGLASIPEAADTIEAIQTDRLNDLGKLLLALGLGDHARAISPAMTLDLCLQEASRLREEVTRYEAAIAAQGEAAS